MFWKADPETPLQGHLRNPYWKIRWCSRVLRKPRNNQIHLGDTEMGKLQVLWGRVKFICCNFMWDGPSLFVCLCSQILKNVFINAPPQHAEDPLACPAPVNAHPGFQEGLRLPELLLELLSTWKWHGSGYSAWGQQIGEEKGHQAEVPGIKYLIISQKVSCTVTELFQSYFWLYQQYSFVSSKTKPNVTGMTYPQLSEALLLLSKAHKSSLGYIFVLVFPNK